MIPAIVAAACLACAAARPAWAQTAADTAALARGTASVIADKMMTVPELVIWAPIDNPFNAAVAEDLRSYPAVSRPAADPRHAMYIGVRSVTIGADTARVRVQTHQQYAEGPGLTAYTSLDDYVFERTAGGWRFLYVRNWSIADMGEVRPVAPSPVPIIFSVDDPGYSRAVKRRRRCDHRKRPPMLHAHAEKP